MTDLRPETLSSPVSLPVPRREVLAWAMYDFANSGYTTVVLTAVFNAYFVGVVAANGADRSGTATLLWTVAMAITNMVVLASAPVLGAIADRGAHKKRFLALTTAGCVFFTMLLGFVGPGDVVLGMTFVILATLMFASGENFIAAFLPEIASQKEMGRISGYGWSLGYLGGLLVLGLCLVYIQWAQSRGALAEQYVPVTMWITAVMFALAALPTFLWLRERAVPQRLAPGETYFRIGFARVRHTLAHARHYRDLFRFLVTLAVYYCGINTVIVLAAIYAQETMGFTMQENIILILVVNVTAAVGALLFGLVQDRLGSVRTLAVTLVVWIAALVLAYLTETRAGFWVVANLVGLALGSSQSAGRALVGQFSPPARAAEFFGLWGLAGKLAAVIGPLVYGLVTYLTHGNHRLALLSTCGFFIAGLLLLMTVNEPRGRAAAVHPG
ncbi:MAG: MFS transporter [Sulfuricaulis sp.]|uniref:MFS transporter n=1 Tax=Sulfuricaulis sp. TaxID=2003553 RepID=UPI0025CB8FC5|nr:MFS transporter [Sulfuricaulis sp.]MCR4347915.1 MFS transporter [Sulfuricaulis sp.]